MKIETEFNIGDIVWDTLTEKRTNIIGISFTDGKKGPKAKVTQQQTIGYWVDDEYLDGGRHPWEIEVFKFYLVRLDAEKHRKKGQMVYREAGKGYYLHTPKKAGSIKILLGDKK